MGHVATPRNKNGVLFIYCPMTRHKVLERQESLQAFAAAHDAPATLIEMLCSGMEVERAIGLTMSSLAKDKALLAHLLQTINARLHRSLSIGGYVAISRLLMALLEQFPGGAMDDALFDLLTMHPDLVPFVASTVIGGQWIARGLEAWVEMRIGSSLVSPERWMLLMKHLLKDAANARLVPRFVSCLGRALDKDRLMASYLTVLELMDDLGRGDHPSSDPLLPLALVSFCLQVKEVEPAMDCTHVLEHLNRCNVAPSSPEGMLLSWVGSHPAWSEEEMFVIFSVAPSVLGAMMMLADYPQISKQSRENTLAEAALKRTKVSPASGPQPDVPSTAHPLMLLLAASASVSRIELDLPLDNFDYAYCYFVCFARHLLQNRDPSALLSLVRLAHRHPALAQRVLLLVTCAIKDAIGREDLATGIKALLEFARIDDFCEVRALLLLRSLLQASYCVRSVILPVLAAALEGEEEGRCAPPPFVFDLISEHLASLVYSGNSSAQGARSFAACVWRLADAQRRQSHLKLAYSAAHGAIRAQASTGQIRELEAQSVALLLASLERLIRAEFVSPKLGTGTDLSCCSTLFIL